MIASLAMYDLPWLKAANDRLWNEIAVRLREHGVSEIPERLVRNMDLDDVWRSPRLLLGQTCGYPLMSELRETVQLVATPRYRAEGCHEAKHRSAIIVRADDPASALPDLRGRSVGVNSMRSNSGMNLLRAAIAPYAGAEAFFGRVILTGSHARSYAGVVSGRIDVAAIDAVTLEHLRRRYPRRAEAVRVLAWSAPSPGLPLVTAGSTTPETLAALRSALASVSKDPALSDTLETLLIGGFETISLDDYEQVLTLEQASIAQQYLELA
jgi:ABC-type phosphate/phosphonate transport system substrate-binding protein